MILEQRKRPFAYSDAVVKEGVKSLMKLEKDANFLKTDIKKQEEKIERMKDYKEIAQRIEDFAETLYNGGYDNTEFKYKSMDEFNRDMELFAREVCADASHNAVGFVVTQTIVRLVSKMVRPKIEAWQLVSRDMVTKEGTVIYNVVVSKEGHATARVSETGEYNSFTLESTEDAIKTHGKIGVKVSFSEEAQKRSGAAAIKQLIEAALYDMARYKSVEAINILESHARTRIDGLMALNIAGYNPSWKATSVAPSGRSFESLDPNGALLLEDLETMLADTQNKGYDVDVFFINPLALGILTNEPAIRQYLKDTANIHFIVPKKKESIARNMVLKMNAKGDEKQGERQSFGIPSGMIMNKQFNIVVTPIVKMHKAGEVIYDPKTRYSPQKIALQSDAGDVLAPANCGDLIMADSSRCLTHVHEGNGIQTDRIDNKLRDVTDIKFKEYYTFLLDKDHGVFAARNLIITKDNFNPKEKMTISHTEYKTATQG